MSNLRISQRYATAFYDFAAERGEVEQAYNDLTTLSDICRTSRELRLLLKSPVINSDKKLKVLHQLFEGKITTVTSSFIDILTRKRREEYIPEIARAFINIYRKEKNIKVAEVITAMPLNDDMRKELSTLLQKQTGSVIILEEHVDPTIIGGLIVRLEGVKFDNTIRRKIQDLRQEFSVNMYIKAF